jgi:hypothetical protein
MKTSFVYCLAVKDEEVKIIRSNLHYLLWLWPRFIFVIYVPCETDISNNLWYVVYNMVVLDSKQQFALLYK